MSTVVPVDFRSRCRIQAQPNEFFDRFLEILSKVGLTSEEIEHTVDAIAHVAVYRHAPEKIRTIVDIFNRNCHF